MTNDFSRRIVRVKLGGGRESRTLLDSFRARETRSPLLPPKLKLRTDLNRYLYHFDTRLYPQPSLELLW